jgi:hypothetical protein
MNDEDYPQDLLKMNDVWMIKIIEDEWWMDDSNYP